MKGRQRGMAIRTDTNRQGWQKSDFPVACQKCYGSNPYVRMLKEDYGQQCRLCFRPFTVFKWKGDRGIYKRTSICQTCSKQKNLCQVCTIDLQFGLPMQIRDKRCGVNGKSLLDQNFTSLANKKFKPPLPPGPPPAPKQNPTDKQLLYIPEKDSSQDEEYQVNEQKLDKQQVNKQNKEKQIEQNLDEAPKIQNLDEAPKVQNLDETPKVQKINVSQ